MSEAPLPSSAAASAAQAPAAVTAPSSSVPPRPMSMLHRKDFIQRVRSYRPMSPSRFLDFPLQKDPALFSHTASLAAAASASSSSTTAAAAAAAAGSSSAPSSGGSLPQAGVPCTSAPGKERIDALLDAVANLYYRRKDTDSVCAGDAWSSQEYDTFQYPSLYLLLTPLRQSHVLDHWSPLELVLFEAGMTSAGKDFHAIHKLIGTKSTNDVVELYYLWKRTSHYAMWKAFQRLTRRFHPLKFDIWARADARVAALATPTHALPQWQPPPVAVAPVSADAAIAALFAPKGAGPGAAAGAAAGGGKGGRGSRGRGRGGAGAGAGDDDAGDDAAAGAGGEEGEAEGAGGKRQRKRVAPGARLRGEAEAYEAAAAAAAAAAAEDGEEEEEEDGGVSVKKEDDGSGAGAGKRPRML